MRLIIDAAEMPGHAQVALQVIKSEAPVFLCAGHTFGKLISRTGCDEHLDQAEDQNRPDQQGNHQLDQRDTALARSSSPAHNRVSALKVRASAPSTQRSSPHVTSTLTVLPFTVTSAVAPSPRALPRRHDHAVL